MEIGLADQKVVQQQDKPAEDKPVASSVSKTTADSKPEPQGKLSLKDKIMAKLHRNKD